MATLPLTGDDLGEAAASLGISISPSTPTIGAEIDGLDLSAGLADREIDVLKRALLRYKVVFFRGQDLSYESHLRVARLFGELEGHPVIPHVPGFPEFSSSRAWRA